MGVTSLVLGILSVLIGLFTGGSLGWLGVIMALIGIIFGALGKKNPESKGISTAGLVLSIIGLVLCIAMYAACIACVGGAATLMN